MDQSNSIKIIIKRISRAILYVKTCTIILGTPSVTRTGLVVKSLFITCQKRVCRGGDRCTWAVEVDTVQHFYCELQLKPHESTLLCEVSIISIGKSFVCFSTCSFYNFWEQKLYCVKWLFQNLLHNLYAMWIEKNNKDFKQWSSFLS